MTPTTPLSEVYSTGKAEKIIIEKSINEIRKGNGYFVSGVITMATGIYTYIFIYPLSTTIEYHVTFKHSAYPSSEIILYEGTGSATTGSVGTILTPYNLHRNQGTGSLHIVQGITTGASGTGSKIYDAYLPEWNVENFGSSDARSNELIIDNTKPYVLGFSGSGAGRLGYEIYWYEQ